VLSCTFVSIYFQINKVHHFQYQILIPSTYKQYINISIQTLEAVVDQEETSKKDAKHPQVILNYLYFYVKVIMLDIF
jgi:hypothetical protein